MRIKKLLPHLFTNLVLFNFVFGDYEEGVVEFYAEEPVDVVEETNLDFTSSNTTHSNTFYVPSVHIDPRNILINQIVNPEFTESDVVVPILDVDSEESNEHSQSKTQEVESAAAEGVVGEDFNHTKENWLEILSVEPSFNESEDVTENVNDDQEPEIKEQTITKKQNDEEFPSRDILKDAINPIFTESEFVPERKFDGEVGSVSTEQNTNKDDKNITDYKNPNSKYEKTKQVSPILEDDTEPEKIELETPSTSDTFVFKNWENIIDLGHSWYELDWFGIFYTAGDDFKGTGWIYHLELGWVFISSKNYESVWIWSDQLGSWKWTSETIFPYLFLDNTKSWLFFNKEKKLFYNYEQDKWFDTLVK
jgi:hypothetical protein